MKKGQECEICIETLNIGCQQFDHRYCELKEKYMTDPNMTADDVITEITLFSTPEQRQAIADKLVEQGAVHR